MALGAVRRAGKWAGVRMLPLDPDDLLEDLEKSAKRTVGYMRNSVGKVKWALECQDELEELVRQAKAVLARVTRNRGYRAESEMFTGDAYWRRNQTQSMIEMHEQRKDASLVKVVRGLEELSGIYGRFMELWEPVVLSGVLEAEDEN